MLFIFWNYFRVGNIVDYPYAQHFFLGVITNQSGSENEEKETEEDIENKKLYFVYTPMVLGS